MIKVINHKKLVVVNVIISQESQVPHTVKLMLHKYSLQTEQTGRPASESVWSLKAVKSVCGFIMLTITLLHSTFVSFSLLLFTENKQRRLGCQVEGFEPHISLQLLSTVEDFCTHTHTHTHTDKHTYMHAHTHTHITHQDQDQCRSRPNQFLDQLTISQLSTIQHFWWFSVNRNLRKRLSCPKMLLLRTLLTVKNSWEAGIQAESSTATKQIMESTLSGWRPARTERVKLYWLIESTDAASL